MVKLKVMSVVGARPNFMKIAPFVHAIERHNSEVGGRRSGEGILIEHYLVHTGQHYDVEMSKRFFEALGIPEPDIDLEIGSGTHAEQVGQTMIAFERVVRKWKPDWVVVVGDVNATCACSITAKKEHVKLAHVEAGLRSGDMRMPEEINRLVTDRLSDLLFTTDAMADENLKREGVRQDRIARVGNIMIDTLEAHREKAAALGIDGIIAKHAIPESVVREGVVRRCAAHTGATRPAARRAASEMQFGNLLEPRCTSRADRVSRDSPYTPAQGRGDEIQSRPTFEDVSCTSNEIQSRPTLPFAVMTLHRPSNVDDADTLRCLVDFFVDEVSVELPILWTIHPRTRQRLKDFDLWQRVLEADSIILLDPLGYHELMALNMRAGMMLTDSGGLQEECCVLGTPCLTLRENTERPVTLVEHGGVSELVGNDIERIRAGFLAFLTRPHEAHRPPLWDGHTAERIVRTLLEKAI